MQQIERTVEIHATIEQVFAFVTDIRNHSLVAPPETQEQLLDPGDVPLRLDSVVRMRARYGGIRWTLATRITEFTPFDLESGTAYFRDEQISGPFAYWRHDHWFASTPDGGTLLADRFTYAAPLGPLGRLAEILWIDRRLRRLLDHMQAAQKQLLESGERPWSE